MNNFIIAIISVLLIFAFITINSFVICDICDDLIDYVEKEQLESAKDLWEKKKFYLSLFIRDAEIDVVTAEFNGVLEKTSIEDGESELNTTSLIDALNELKHSEKPSFNNVFVIDIN